MPLLSITTPASSHDLTTLTLIKDELDINPVEDDAQLARLITRASRMVERITGRIFAQERVVETLEGYGDVHLLLSRTPIVTVHGITVDSDPLSDFTIKDNAAGVLHREAGWAWSSGIWWGAGQTRITGSEVPKFAVDYTGGWILPSNAGTRDLPEDIEAAAVELVRFLRDRPGEGGAIKQETIGDYSVTYGSTSTERFPRAAVGLLEPWIQAF